MGRRGARLTVAVLFAITIAVAGWQYLRSDRIIGAERAAGDAFERDARSLVTSVVDLRSAQQAYVALGQGINYWTARFSSLSGLVRSGLVDLKSRSISPEATRRIDAAVASLDDYIRMDSRVREYAKSGDQLLASDLIFAEGFEMTEGLVADLDAALGAEVEARRRALAAAVNRRQALAAGAVLVGLLLMLILALAGSPQREETAEPALEPAPIEQRTPATGPLALLPPTRHEPQEAPKIDLAAAADLCRDLARVTSTQQIPGLLERAARILDASGIVLWIADPDGRELIPTTTQGYPSAAVARLTTIPRGADNATAAAYREGVVHTVKGDVHTHGAVVAPLVAAHGCIGVMAAEVKSPREQQDAVRAIAAIVAAQLATLIGVSPAARPVEQRDAAGA